MTPDQINESLVPILRDAILGIAKLESKLIVEINYYYKNHRDWIKDGDFRPGTIARLLSSLIPLKFFINILLDYIGKKDWPNDFQEKYIPEPWKQNDYYGHLEEIVQLIRFQIVHSFYSQIEATHRLIMTAHNKRKKPAKAVNELTGTYRDPEIRFYDAIRNTIHNNGYHIPLEKENYYFTHILRGKEFHFNLNKPVNINMNDLINIIDDQIDKIIATLRSNSVKKMKIIKDIS